jgi:hypothetical protein
VNDLLFSCDLNLREFGGTSILPIFPQDNRPFDTSDILEGFYCEQIPKQGNLYFPFTSSHRNICPRFSLIQCNQLYVGVFQYLSSLRTLFKVNFPL